MTTINNLNGLVLLLISIVLLSCKSTSNTTESTSTTNSEASLKKPYLILISLDGFRWDYVEKYNPPNLRKFIDEGVRAESLIPSFPSKTFPNHYTIATGMYPDNHGIIGNSFYSHKKDVTYRIGNREMVEDGTFYGGSPIWVQADKAEMVSASYFFVGSEANVQGIRPTYFYTYDGSIKNEVRVNQALKWLALPERDRPHMITMYFSDMDDAGHRNSPSNSDAIKKKLFDLDKTLGDLFKGTKETGLPINIVIVSDHGMTDVKSSNYIPIELVQNDSLYLTIDNGAIVNIHPKNPSKVDSIYHYLKEKEDNFRVYKTEDTPGFEYKPTNKDWGPIQVIPNYGYYFSTRSRIESFGDATFGVHGFDPINKDMHGIFYANGPAFKKGFTTASVKNIHIYPLMCDILGLDIPNNIDGNLDQLKGILRE